MLEIAGGVMLAIAILFIFLANFSWIIVALSALAALGLVVAGIIVLLALPAEFRNVILAGLIACGGFAVVAAPEYWTHVDRRFLVPDDDKAKPPNLAEHNCCAGVKEPGVACDAAGRGWDLGDAQSFS